MTKVSKEYTLDEDYETFREYKLGCVHSIKTGETKLAIIFQSGEEIQLSFDQSLFRGKLSDNIIPYIGLFSVESYYVLILDCDKSYLPFPKFQLSEINEDTKKASLSNIANAFSILTNNGINVGYCYDSSMFFNEDNKQMYIGLYGIKSAPSTDNNTNFLLFGLLFFYNAFSPFMNNQSGILDKFLSGEIDLDANENNESNHDSNDNNESNNNSDEANLVDDQAMKPYEFEPENWEERNTLNSFPWGEFGTVTNNEGETFYFISNDGHNMLFCPEMEQLFHLDFPYLLKYKGFFVDFDNFIVIDHPLNLITYEDWEDLNEDDKEFKARTLYQLATAIYFLNERQIHIYYTLKDSLFYDTEKKCFYIGQYGTHFSKGPDKERKNHDFKTFYEFASEWFPQEFDDYEKKDAIVHFLSKNIQLGEYTKQMDSEINSLKSLLSSFTDVQPFTVQLPQETEEEKVDFSTINLDFSAKNLPLEQCCQYAFKHDDFEFFSTMEIGKTDLILCIDVNVEKYPKKYTPPQEDFYLNYKYLLKQIGYIKKSNKFFVFHASQGAALGGYTNVNNYLYDDTMKAKHIFEIAAAVRYLTNKNINIGFPLDELIAVNPTTSEFLLGFYGFAELNSKEQKSNDQLFLELGSKWYPKQFKSQQAEGIVDYFLCNAIKLPSSDKIKKEIRTIQTLSRINPEEILSKHTNTIVAATFDTFDCGETGLLTTNALYSSSRICFSTTIIGSQLAYLYSMKRNGMIKSDVNIKCFDIPLNDIIIKQLQFYFTKEMIYIVIDDPIQSNKLPMFILKQNQDLAIKLFLYGVATGMLYLHQQGLCFGTFNPFDHVMINSANNPYPYLIGYGFPACFDNKGIKEDREAFLQFAQYVRPQTFQNASVDTILEDIITETIKFTFNEDQSDEQREFNQYQKMLKKKVLPLIKLDHYTPGEVFESPDESDFHPKFKCKQSFKLPLVDAPYEDSNTPRKVETKEEKPEDKLEAMFSDYPPDQRASMVQQASIFYPKDTKLNACKRLVQQNKAFTDFINSNRGVSGTQDPNDPFNLSYLKVFIYDYDNMKSKTVKYNTGSDLSSHAYMAQMYNDQQPNFHPNAKIFNIQMPTLAEHLGYVIQNDHFILLADYQKLSATPFGVSEIMISNNELLQAKTVYGLAAALVYLHKRQIICGFDEEQVLINGIQNIPYLFGYGVQDLWKNKTEKDDNKAFLNFASKYFPYLLKKCKVETLPEDIVNEVIDIPNKTPEFLEYKKLIKPFAEEDVYELTTLNIDDLVAKTEEDKSEDKKKEIENLTDTIYEEVNQTNESSNEQKNEDFTAEPANENSKNEIINENDEKVEQEKSTDKSPSRPQLKSKESKKEFFFSQKFLTKETQKLINSEVQFLDNSGNRDMASKKLIYIAQSGSRISQEGLEKHFPKRPAIFEIVFSLINEIAGDLSCIGYNSLNQDEIDFMSAQINEYPKVARQKLQEYIDASEIEKHFLEGNLHGLLEKAKSIKDIDLINQCAMKESVEAKSIVYLVSEKEHDLDDVLSMQPESISDLISIDSSDEKECLLAIQRLFCGIGCSQNQKDALQKIEQFESQEAYYIKGLMLYSMNNYTNSVTMLEKAGDFKKAELLVHLIRYFTFIVESNDNEEFDFFLNHNSIEAKIIAAYIYKQQSKYTEAYLLFKEIADEAHHKVALFECAKMQYLGLGTVKNEYKSIPYLVEAALQGNRDAILLLNFIPTRTERKHIKELIQADNQNNALFIGKSYEEGRVLDQDYCQAFNYYFTVPQQSYALLGRLYEFGRGTSLDLNKAIELYNKGVENGDPESMCQLGILCLRGKGVNKTTSKAQYYFNEATSLKSSRGAFLLASCYEFLGKISEAKKFYDISAKMGSQHGQLCSALIMERNDYFKDASYTKEYDFIDCNWIFYTSKFALSDGSRTKIDPIEIGTFKELAHQGMPIAMAYYPHLLYCRSPKYQLYEEASRFKSLSLDMFRANSNSEIDYINEGSGYIDYDDNLVHDVLLNMGSFDNLYNSTNDSLFVLQSPQNRFSHLFKLNYDLQHTREMEVNARLINLDTRTLDYALLDEAAQKGSPMCNLLCAIINKNGINKSQDIELARTYFKTAVSLEYQPALILIQRFNKEYPPKQHIDQEPKEYLTRDMPKSDGKISPNDDDISVSSEEDGMTLETIHDGTNNNQAEDIRILELAAANGDQDSIFDYAWHLQYGIGIQKDNAKAEEQYSRLNDPASKFILNVKYGRKQRLPFLRHVTKSQDKARQNTIEDNQENEEDDNDNGCNCKSCFNESKGLVDQLKRVKELFSLILVIIRTIQACSLTTISTTNDNESNSKFTKYFQWATDFLQTVTDGLKLEPLTNEQSGLMMSLLVIYFFSFAIFGIRRGARMMMAMLISSLIYCPIGLGISYRDDDTIKYCLIFVFLGYYLILYPLTVLLCRYCLKRTLNIIVKMLLSILFAPAFIIGSLFYIDYLLIMKVDENNGIEFLVPFVKFWKMTKYEKFLKKLVPPYNYLDIPDIRHPEFNFLFTFGLTFVIMDLLALMILRAGTIYYFITCVLGVIFIALIIIVAIKIFFIQALNTYLAIFLSYLFLYCSNIILNPAMDMLTDDEYSISNISMAFIIVFAIFLPFAANTLIALTAMFQRKQYHPVFLRGWIKSAFSLTASACENYKARMLYWPIIDYIYHILYAISAGFFGSIVNIIIAAIYTIIVWIMRPNLALSENVLISGEPIIMIILNIILLIIDTNNTIPIGLGIAFIIISFIPAIACILIYYLFEKNKEFSQIQQDMIYETKLKLKTMKTIPFFNEEVRSKFFVSNSYTEIMYFKFLKPLTVIGADNLKEDDFYEPNALEKVLDRRSTVITDYLNDFILTVGFILLYSVIGYALF